MTSIYKICLGIGVLATGGEVVTHGDKHAATLKKMANQVRLDRRPDKGIREVSVSEFSHLPFGVKRIEE